METPTISKLFHFAPPALTSLGSCFGMRMMETPAMGMHTSVTNQKTHFHEAYCTKIAPMTSPRTAEGSMVSSLPCFHHMSARPLTVADSAAATKHAEGTGLLSGLGEDVDEERDGGGDGP